MTHTPTPWAYEPFVIGYGDPDWAKYIINSGGDEEYTVATIIGDVSAIDAEANAAFIVKAVNSHDKLVEALREARVVLENGLESGPMESEASVFDRVLLAKIAAALEAL